MKNQLEYFLFILLSRFVCLIGLTKARKFARLLAFFFFYIIPIRKKIVFKNLHLAFPSESETEIKTIAYNSYISFAISLVEILSLPVISDEEMKRFVRFDNISMIREKFELGKGVVLLSGHFGNWEFCALSSSLQVGIPFNVVVKNQRNPFVNNWMTEMREKWINKVIPLGASIRQVYKALLEKNIIAMVADQRGPADATTVNMFGIKSAAYTGPAVLALKNNSPILIGLTVRQKDYTYKITLEEIDYKELTGSEEEKVNVLTQCYASILEKYIRKNPEQWFWMHNRWKY